MAEERWDDFRVFLQVAKSSSIKRAAANLNITQSAVSKRVDRLEETLGVQLFERGPGGTKLTIQGQKILAHALSAEAELANAAKAVRQPPDRISGQCRMQMSDGITLMPTYLTIHDPDLVPIDIGMRVALKLLASYRRENASRAAVRSTMNFLREHVFDPKNMPWFSDDFVKPGPGWAQLHAAALARALAPVILAAK